MTRLPFLNPYGLLELYVGGIFVDNGGRTVLRHIGGKCGCKLT